MKTPVLIVASRLVLAGGFGLDLKAAEPFEKETVVYKEAGALAIKADVYHYSDSQVRPVVVSLHGGALMMGHRGNLDSRVRSFALTNGFVLVSFDYRLAPETQFPAIIDVEQVMR
jgi:acetyl esterase/lipase